MLDEPENLNILEGVMGLAAAFQRQVIAEGVETVEHGLMLLQMGCELAQGYGIAAPMPAERTAGLGGDVATRSAVGRRARGARREPAGAVRQRGAPRLACGP